MLFHYTFSCLHCVLPYFLLSIGADISFKHIDCTQREYSSVTSVKHSLYCYMIDYITIAGEHISYRQLDYTPRIYSCITYLSSSHFMVAQEHPPAIHIHLRPSGEIVRTITHLELGLLGNDSLYGVNLTGLLLHLVVGKYGNAESLRTYKV